jgi:large subunit ribosomal protein L21
MYAVIRAGGKQYRVAPGDVIRVEKQAATEASLEFELLAVGNDGKISSPKGEARVTGEVLGEGREKKILVFHYKRKKQYKKLAGHRQPFTTVRITEIAYDGESHKAAEKTGAAPQKG